MIVAGVGAGVAVAAVISAIHSDGLLSISASCYGVVHAGNRDKHFK